VRFAASPGIGMSATDTTRQRSASGDGLVVATKLHIPIPLPDRISRPALLAELEQASRARLILVSAPAGAGKTTLLASWHRQAAGGRPFAWVSLDSRDNDPVRFWGCVLLALRTLEPELGPGVEAALRAPGADVTELAMPLLINALTSLKRRIVLVLDDYHVIENLDVHRSIEFVVDHLPDTLQIAVATRTDPPFALARLRARAELVEVRVSDLRLSASEAATLLNGSMGLELEPEQIRSLQERTEGWAAGLQLVGLSLAGRGDRADYIASFAGDDRQIVDYLAAEVLDRQTPETRRFLLRSAILERLCGPLCDEVAEAEDSARLLIALERANLFLVPLDGQRVWYRYHHLFRDLLLHELRLGEPGIVEELHRRACGWYAGAGFIPEAIAHATAAGHFAQAAELIAANWLTYVNRGQLETVEAWTRALPSELATTDARLCLARAWMLLVLGRPGEVEAEVVAAERAEDAGPMRDGSRSVAASAAMVRTSARLLLGDVGGATHSAAEAERLEPDRDAPWRPIVTNALGMTAYWSGNTEHAVSAFRETVSAAERVGNHTAAIYALGYLAAIEADRRQFAQAEELCATALALGHRQDLGEHWVSVMVYYAAASCAQARGELEEARRTAERGLDLARRGGLRLDTVYGLIALSAIASASGEYDAARELHTRAERQLAACADPGMLRALVGRAATAPAGTIADDLSERELAVLRLLPTQLSLREISGELYVSVNTVKTHVRNIYAKLRVSSREQAIARAHELALL
jgi:LuxR family maltose regulon positive regulatory protein